MDSDALNGPSSRSTSGSGWESNPPRPATRPATGFEDQEAHRDLTTPTCKDNRRQEGLQDNLLLCIKNKCSRQHPATPIDFIQNNPQMWQIAQIEEKIGEICVIGG